MQRCQTLSWRLLLRADVLSLWPQPFVAALAAFVDAFLVASLALFANHKLRDFSVRFCKLAHQYHH